MTATIDTWNTNTIPPLARDTSPSIYTDEEWELLERTGRFGVSKEELARRLRILDTGQAALLTTVEAPHAA